MPRQIFPTLSSSFSFQFYKSIETIETLWSKTGACMCQNVKAQLYSMGEGGDKATLRICVFMMVKPWKSFFSFGPYVRRRFHLVNSFCSGISQLTLLRMERLTLNSGVNTPLWLWEQANSNVMSLWMSRFVALLCSQSGNSPLKCHKYDLHINKLWQQLWYLRH